MPAYVTRLGNMSAYVTGLCNIPPYVTGLRNMPTYVTGLRNMACLLAESSFCVFPSGWVFFFGVAFWPGLGCK